MKLEGIALAALLAAAQVPDGIDQLRWGMTSEQLAKAVPVHKADKAHGYGYAEHMEADPDVYVQPSDSHKHREYYLFRGKLYKVFTVYNRAFTNPENYAKLVEDLKTQFGEPARRYDDQNFGIRVTHTEWASATTTLDLRMGAGFIYEVRFENRAVQEKKTMRQLKRSI
jgi:hypothetical protein